MECKALFFIHPKQGVVLHVLTFLDKTLKPDCQPSLFELGIHYGTACRKYKRKPSQQSLAKISKICSYCLILVRVQPNHGFDENHHTLEKLVNI